MLAALKWVLKNKNVHTTIPSITDMEQLDENMRAMTVPFTRADQKILAAQLEHIRPLYCRMCGKCAGVCPKGLPVADVLRYLSYAEGYGEYQLGRESFLALPRRSGMCAARFAPPAPSSARTVCGWRNGCSVRRSCLHENRNYSRPPF